MSQLFVPEGIENQDLEKILEPRPVEKVYFEDDNFVFACGKELFMLPIVEGYECGHGEPISLCEREENIVDICVHDGVLYDVDYKGYLRETFSNNIYIERFVNPRRMCSHNGELYIAYQSNEVTNALKKRADDMVSPSIIADIVSYQDQLLVSTESGKIWDIENDVVVKDVQNELIDMCVHKSKLYYTYRGPKTNTYRMGVLGKPINLEMSTPHGYPRGLCSHRGKYGHGVYHPSGRNIIRSTVDATPISYKNLEGGETFEMPHTITRLRAIPKSVMDER